MEPLLAESCALL